MSPSYKAFAINLKSNAFRRDHILDQQEKAGMDIEIFDAVTPATMEGLPHQYDKLKARKFTGRPLEDTEIACGLSHLMLWRQLLTDQTHDFYLIMEDDVVLSEGLDELIKAIDFEHVGFLKLSGKIDRKTRKVQSLGNEKGVYKYSFGPLDAACYMINKDAAKRLIPYCEKLFAPIDILMDRSFEHGVTIYGILPYPVTADFCFDEASPFYTSIGKREKKYADDITLSEKLWHRFYRLRGSVKRKLAILRLNKI